MSALIGFLINLQFFTAIPIKREFPMDNKYLHRAIQTFPLVGLLLGCLMSGTLYLFVEWTPFSTSAIAFMIWLLTIGLTGGLHLDGWIDASDAFFSYRDKKKRLEIMKDPRTGAFGVLSVIVLLAARFLFIYEIIEKSTPYTYALILVIPFISKIVMGVVLCRFPFAKQEGLGAYFQKASRKNSTHVYWGYAMAGLIGAYLISPALLWQFIWMAAAAYLSFLFIRKKTIEWFGGITGDVLGASVEGVELSLWITVWLLHYFVMG
ncbi:adenosylcobinamide-GDP ribazoletransferase [Peribacillus sp. FSL H8-0477]|uniref:adenosylcobinamide-GDP ribazoletransferase n=1 Tax=Peribacillus sp. FSL H8-0477 TaxID=2921388 RepID=UPI0030F5B472